MSMISKQIDELRDYAKDRKGELAKLINDAADTIEELSAKLHAKNMEQSSQYYDNLNELNAIHAAIAGLDDHDEVFVGYLRAEMRKAREGDDR